MNKLVRSSAVPPSENADKTFPSNSASQRQLFPVSSTGNDTQSLLPLFRYVGGKRKLAKQICATLPRHCEGTYYEPFCGGAAILCHLQNEGALHGPVSLLDYNFDLMNVYQTVKQALPQHLARLASMSTQYNKGPVEAERLFHRVRDEWNAGIHTADRFVFLKKTAFNGLWRVNRKGEFNVGWGKYPRMDVDVDMHWQWHTFLQRHEAQLKAGDATTWPFPQPQRGDWVYFDPPYVDTFGAYTEEGFTTENQITLLNFAREWDSKGVVVAWSNSLAARPLVERYWPEAQTHEFMISYAVNCDGGGREKKAELYAVSRQGTR